MTATRGSLLERGPSARRGSAATTVPSPSMWVGPVMSTSHNGAVNGERNVSDVVVDRLRAWGVQRVFGYSGDGINGVLGALRRAGNEPEFVQARHEEAAAFMA